MDLSIAIQHTPGFVDRRRWVEGIVAQLTAEQTDVAVTVVEDIDREGCWPTYLRTLNVASGAAHHLVLQDDVALCKDFISSVREVIQARPENLVALYTNSHSVFAARNRRESWIETARVGCPALIWPYTLIGEFIAWQRKHIAKNFPWDDARVSMWLTKTSKRAFATVPSLAQHDGCQASILGLNGKSKTAAWYVGSKRSGRGIDWTQGRRSPAKDWTQIKQDCWQYFRA